MNLSALLDDEKLFLRRIEDLFRGWQPVPRFSAFLTERRQDIVRAFLEQSGNTDCALLFGGYAGAERKMLGAFPAWEKPDASVFPVFPVTLRHRRADTLSHRDFLGALLSLRITRESIGDILPGDGMCVVFVQNSVAPLVLEELRTVGRVGVKCEQGFSKEEIRTEHNFEPLHGTVASCRADCLVSLLTGKSREKAAALIKAEHVQLNYAVVTSPSKLFAPGDVAALRGYGKFIVDAIGNPTRKGRLPVDIRKYK